MNIFNLDFENQPLLNNSVRWPYLNFLAEFLCQTLTLLLTLHIVLYTHQGEFLFIAQLWWAIAATGAIRLLCCEASWKLVFLVLGTGGAGFVCYHLYQNYTRGFQTLVIGA